MRRRQAGFVEGALLVLGILVGVGVVALVLWASYSDWKRWEAFKAEHACKVVGHMKGQCRSGYGFTSSGKGVSTFECDNDRVEWLCDDGVRYWR